jgi:preprotein translocase subunit SecD
MGAVRVVRTVVPLVLMAGALAGCGDDSSSSSGTGDAAASLGPAVSSTVQFRLVSARYAQDTSQGQEQIGPPPPKSLVDTMKGYDCSSKPTVVQGLLMECDASKSVYLLNAPLITGGVASAKPLPVGSGQEWYVRVTFDDAATSTLAKTADSSTGSDLAVVLDGKVITAVLVDSSMKDGHIGITGDYDKTSATKLAQELSS